MYDHVGNKIKVVAKVFFGIYLVLGFLAALALLIIGIVEEMENYIYTAFIVLLVYPIVGYISSLFLYGFGQIVNNTDRLVESLCDNKTKKVESNEKIEESSKDEIVNNNPSSFSSKRKRIENLYNNNLITKEQYLTLLKKLEEEENN